jgi:Ca2+-binding RTX toxin-like protein
LVTGTNADDTIRVQYTDSFRDEIVITIKDADGNLLEEEDYSADSVDRIIVNGLNGDDYLRNDTRIGCELNGGNGIDLLVGGRSADVLRGGFGDDSLYGQSGDDVLQGEAGDDFIKGSYGNDLIDGGDGDDTLEGGRDSDTIDGGDGNDAIYGGRTYLTSFRAGDDVINGGDGNDTIRGGYGDDTLNGNDGRDTKIAKLKRFSKGGMREVQNVSRKNEASRFLQETGMLRSMTIMCELPSVNPGDRTSYAQDRRPTHRPVSPPTRLDAGLLLGGFVCADTCAAAEAVGLAQAHRQGRAPGDVWRVGVPADAVVVVASGCACATTGKCLDCTGGLLGDR